MNIFENKIIQFVLFPLSLLYGIVIYIRNKFYDFGIFRIYKVDKCKIISVGNITVGGTGKTPVIKHLANHLKNMGFSVAILSRGYGRKTKELVVVSDFDKILAGPENAGDEPYLLAKNLPGIPVVVEGNRYKGALHIQDSFHVDFILLDDGYQHRRLYRDFNIALIDASQGFGNGFLLPAGKLREPVNNLRRADLIWFTRIDQSKDLIGLEEKVKGIKNFAIVKSVHKPGSLVNISELNKKYDISFLENKKVVMFSGIGNPESFDKTVTNLGAIIKAHFKFSDHHRYRDEDIKRIINEAKKFNADIILTTEKDAVKLNEFMKQNLQIYFLSVDIVSDEMPTIGLIS